MAISSTNAIINQYVPDMYIKSPVTGETLIYDPTISGFRNSPITTASLGLLGPADFRWENDASPGDVVTLSDDLTTFKSLARSELGGPGTATQLNDLNDVGIISPILQNHVMAYDTSNDVWTNRYVSYHELINVPTNIVTDGSDVTRLVNNAGYITIDDIQVPEVFSVFNRVGTINAEVGDYNTDLIINESTVSGATLTVALDALSDRIDNSGGGGSSTGLNIGTGDGIYADTANSVLNFKTLIAGNGLALTPSADEIVITLVANTVTDAPEDGTPYVRQDSTWVTPENNSLFESAMVSYDANGVVTGISDASAGITTTTDLGNSSVSFEFAHSRPPASIVCYGYSDLGVNGFGYVMSTIAGGNMSNVVLTGGTSSNPAQDLLNMATPNIRLQLSTTETLADVSEHAHIFFLF